MDRSGFVLQRNPDDVCGWWRTRRKVWSPRIFPNYFNAFGARTRLDRPPNTADWAWRWRRVLPTCSLLKSARLSPAPLSRCPSAALFIRPLQCDSRRGRNTSPVWFVGSDEVSIRRRRLFCCDDDPPLRGSGWDSLPRWCGRRLGAGARSEPRCDRAFAGILLFQDKVRALRR